MSRLLLILLLCGVPAARAGASDIYYAATAQGANNGTSCADAYAYSDASNGWNQSAPQTAGNTLHLCGTITGTANQTILTATNSGTGSAPITLKWEDGAILGAPYFQGNRTTPTCGINLNSKSWWVLDGGSNGVMENTANGTGLANQADSCFINATGTSNVTIKNGLTLGPAYIHKAFQQGVSVTGNGTTATATCKIANCGFANGEGGLSISGGSRAELDGTGLTVTAVSGNTLSYASTTQGSGSGYILSDSNGGNTFGVFYQNAVNLTINGVTIHDVRWCTFLAYAAANGITGLTITNNNLYSCDHGVGGGSNANNATMAGALVQNNHFHDFVNWDALCGTAGLGGSANFCFHHDYIHIWAHSYSGAQITGLVIDKNFFDGDSGLGMTAQVNLESQVSNNSYHNGTVVSNNVFNNGSETGLQPYGYISSGGKNEVVVNNTVLGSSSSRRIGNNCFYMGKSGTNATFENNVCSQVGYAIIAAMPAATWTSIDYNYYHLFNSNMYFACGAACGNGIISYSDWLARCGSCDTHSKVSSAGSPNITKSSPWKPNGSGAPVVGAAKNLTSLCSTTPQICVDFNGVTRPATGNWDMGAAQFAASR